MLLLDVEAIGAEKEGEVITVLMGGTTFNLGSLVGHALLGLFFHKPLDKLQHHKSVFPLKRNAKTNTTTFPMT